MAAVARRPPRYRREVNAERRQARRVGLYTGGTVDRQQRRMYILLAKFISKRGEVCPPIREVDTGRSEELRQCVLHELARMAACTACARECDHTYSSRRSRATDCKPLAASHWLIGRAQPHQALLGYNAIHAFPGAGTPGETSGEPATAVYRSARAAWVHCRPTYRRPRQWK